MIATVNGYSITDNDLEQEMNAILAQTRQQIPQDQMSQMLPEIRKQAIESIINRQLLYEEVDRQEIALDEEKVKTEVKNIAGRFPSPSAFEDQLKNLGISLEQMEKDLGQQFRVDTLIRSYVDTKNIEVNENELSEFFNDNRDSFQTPEQVRASHILLKVEADASQDLKSQKRLELAGILGRIEKGADFADMAQNHSD